MNISYSFDFESNSLGELICNHGMCCNCTLYVDVDTNLGGIKNVFWREA